MVLHYRRDSELLAFRSLWPELDLSVVEPNDSSVADSSLDSSILCWLVDRLSLDLLTPVKKPLLDPACFRNGSRCSSVGADPLEHVEHGPVSALDGWTNRQYFSRTVALAMAWTVRCYARSW